MIGPILWLRSIRERFEFRYARISLHKTWRRSKRTPGPAENYAKFVFAFQKGLKPCDFKGSGDHRNTKGNWELIFEISCAYYRSQTIGNGKVVWTERHLFRHDICFLSISSFCGSSSQSFDCHSLREGVRPQAMAFIYRDRLIWVCRFKQRRLNCTQGNSSCKTSYEYMTLA